jgi:hypothetical protein
LLPKFFAVAQDVEMQSRSKTNADSRRASEESGVLNDFNQQQLDMDPGQGSSYDARSQVVHPGGANQEEELFSTLILSVNCWRL